MKILHLTIKRKWFDLIASGKKPWEYREEKSYWRSRLLRWNGVSFVCKEYDEIWFYAGGYCSQKLPFMRCKWNGWKWACNTTPLNGEAPGGDDFAIDVSEVLEVKEREK